MGAIMAAGSSLVRDDVLASDADARPVAGSGYRWITGTRGAGSARAAALSARIAAALAAIRELLAAVSEPQLAIFHFFLLWPTVVGAGAGRAGGADGDARAALDGKSGGYGGYISSGAVSTRRRARSSQRG